MFTLSSDPPLVAGARGSETDSPRLRVDRITVLRTLRRRLQDELALMAADDDGMSGAGSSRLDEAVRELRELERAPAGRRVSP